MQCCLKPCSLATCAPPTQQGAWQQRLPDGGRAAKGSSTATASSPIWYTAEMPAATSGLVHSCVRVAATIGVSWACRLHVADLTWRHMQHASARPWIPTNSPAHLAAAVGSHPQVHPERNQERLQPQVGPHGQAPAQGSEH